MAEVILDQVSKIYPGGILAVDNASLHVEDKEFAVLVGPSGCGKSTTLRMIAGLEEITKGEIKIGARVVNDVPPKDRDIAMVFQNYALYPHMTVYKNMAFGLKLRKYPKKEIDERVRTASNILGITELLDRKPKALSGGQRQRVAVGRAIVRQPQVFLFDEPLSNLDAKLRLEMRAELNKLHNRLRTTMVYVTHDQVEAMTLGDRIVVMNEGLIQQVAEPLDLYDHPINRFVASFIGTPPMNFLEGTLLRDGETMLFDEGVARIRLPESMSKNLFAYADKSVSLGIRPENMVAQITPGDAEQNGATLRTRVTVVEPLGDQMLLYLNTGKHDIIGKVDPSHSIRVDQEIDIVLDVEKLHIFEDETGKNISLSGE